MFRQTLISTIRMAQESYDNLILDRVAARRVRGTRLRVGFWLANVCIGGIGLVNLAAGIIALLAGNVALFAIRNVVDFFYQMTDPMLGVGDRVAELILKHHRVPKKSMEART